MSPHWTAKPAASRPISERDLEFPNFRSNSLEMSFEYCNLRTDRVFARASWGSVARNAELGENLSQTYKAYVIKHLQALHPPYSEIVEVDFESAVLDASSFSNSSIQNLDEDDTEFTW